MDATTVVLVEEEDRTPKKRRNLGRQARRRRKKVLEIEAAACATRITTTTPNDSSTSSKSVLPTDREYVWPAVMERCTLTKADKAALVAQLGYLPGNALSVAARMKDVLPLQQQQQQQQPQEYDNDNSPLVLKLYPLVYRDETDGTKSRRKRRQRKEENNCLAETSTKPSGDNNNNNHNNNKKKKKRNPPLMEPFPTIYWVTNPRVKALISKLELEKMGLELEQRLKESANDLESMKKAHQEYGNERLDLITSSSKDWKWIQEKGWEPAFASSRGVAGIRNLASIKCLHAHAAHYWSGCQHNIVGKLVADKVSSMMMTMMMLNPTNNKEE